jgi:hypothetical protein
LDLAWRALGSGAPIPVPSSSPSGAPSCFFLLQAGFLLLQPVE